MISSSLSGCFFLASPSKNFEDGRSNFAVLHQHHIAKAERSYKHKSLNIILCLIQGGKRGRDFNYFATCIYIVES